MLEGKQYNYKKTNEIYTIVESQDSVNIYNDEPFIDTLTHFGLLAQEVQVYFPELVQTDTEGFLGLDYNGLIPVIIEVLKQQQIEIDELNRKIKEKDQELIETKTVYNDEFLSRNSASLNQNAPNPFNEDTRIGFFISEKIETAIFYIYDLQGKQIKSEEISQREHGEYIITGSEFEPGIYYYSLITDGKLVGTKSMILTD